MVKSAVFLATLALIAIAAAGARAETRLAPGMALLSPAASATLSEYDRIALAEPVVAQLDIRSRDPRDAAPGAGAVAMPILACALGVLGLVRLRRGGA